MRSLLAVLLVLVATPAFAQFPPPGVYVCVGPDNTAFGELALLPAGDYDLTTPDGASHTGQIASAGTNVRALSGTLFDDYHLTGAFGQDQSGNVVFAFTSDIGEIGCGPPAP